MKIRTFLCTAFISLITFMQSQGQNTVNITATVSINSWTDGYTAIITITPNVAITSWQVSINMTGTPNNIYNATSTNSGSTYTFSSMSYNSIVSANATNVSFGFGVNGSSSDAPRISASNIIATGVTAGNPSTQVVLSSYWLNSGQNIYLSPSYTGNVGIGTSTPSAGLSLLNSTAATINLQQGSNSPFWIGSNANGMQIGGTGTSYPATGAINIDNSGNVTIPKNTFLSGTLTIPLLSTGIVHSTGGLLSSSAINVSSDVSGVLPVANGGTNNASLALTNGGILYADGSRLQTSKTGTAGQILTSNGAGAPSWTNPISRTDANFNVFTGFSSGISNTTGGGNIFTGFASGISNTTGNSNIFFGIYAGYSNTTGSENMFTGHESGFSNTTGSNNIFNGYLSGHSNTTGGENIFNGYFTGRANTTGSNNIFNGFISGVSNTTGSENIFTGYSSGYANTTGSNNIFEGTFAGNSSVSANNNTYIGYSAGKSNTGDNNIFIGSMAGAYETSLSNKYILGTSASTPYLMYGDFATNQIGIGTNTLTPGYALNVAGGILLNPSIGATTPTLQVNGNTTLGTPGTSNTLTVNGTTNLTGSLSVNGTIGTAGQVLTSNGTGTLSWTSPSVTDVSGILPIANGGTNNANLAVTNGGVIYADGTRLQTSIAGTVGQVLTSNGTGTPLWTSPLSRVDGNWNIFTGVASGISNTTGYYNIFTGFESGISNTTGNYNIFTGFESGHSNTTGLSNIFTGYDSGLSNTTGEGNIFTGVDAGHSNTTGRNNIFTGFYSGYSSTTASNNLFDGDFSGFSNTTGSENIFTGSDAGHLNTTGSNNVFNGYQAGYNNTTGGENIFTGYKSGVSNTKGSNNVFNGYAAGLYNTTGINNVFDGYGAGFHNVSTSNNTYIGTEAGGNNIGENNVFIGSYAGTIETSLSNKYILGTSTNLTNGTYLMYGDFATNQIGIGTKTLTNGYALNVAGGILVNSTAEATTPTLQVNGSLSSGATTIGTPSALSTLTVNGTLNTTGVATLGSLISTGAITIGTPSTLSTLTVNGTINTSGVATLGSLISTGDATITGNTSITGITSISGNTTITGTLKTTEKATFPSLSCYGRATFNDVWGNGMSVFNDVWVGNDFGCNSLYIGSAESANLGNGSNYIGFNVSRDKTTNTWSTGGWQNNGGAVMYSTFAGDIVFSSIAGIRGTQGQTGIDDNTIMNSATLRITPTFVNVKALNVKTNVWADYVFKKDYKLRSLKEVEAYINTNSHLPEVPSTEEVTKNGINVAEMNATLLKKVEELTLYMIDQNKRITQLEKQNAELVKTLKK
jgi:hypothetical protein